jgi:hypothetical protein
MFQKGYKQLGMAITYEAIEEFIEDNGHPRKQAAIIKQLKTPYMDFISNGLSVILAEKLETNPTEVCERVKKLKEAVPCTIQ